MEKILLLLSGGKDSMLSACRLLSLGYEVYLVNYDNSCTLDIELYNSSHTRGSIDNAADELIRRFGSDRVKFLGTKMIVGTWHEFFLPFVNMKPTQIAITYGEIPISQFNCLTCRSAMYFYSIALCLELGIKHLAEGARVCQQFVIELPPMVERFNKLTQAYGINAQYPLLTVTDDHEVQRELLNYGIRLGHFESSCLIGAPIDSEYPIDSEVIAGTVNFFQSAILPHAEKLIEHLRKIIRIDTPYRNEKRFY